MSRPLRFRGVRRAAGPEYWLARARFFGFLATFVGAVTLLDIAVRIIGGEPRPRLSTLAAAAVVWLLLARAAHNAGRKAGGRRQPD